MKGPPNTNRAVIPKTHVPAANTAAVITVAAVAGEMHVVEWVSWSFNSPPTTDDTTLTIAYGTGPTTKYTIYTGPDTATYNAAVRGHYVFPGGFHYDSKTLNEQLVITLSAGGNDVLGSVNAGVS